MDWQRAFIPGSKPDGTPILSVMGKATYTIGPGKASPADEPLELVTEDVYADTDNPLYSEVAAETDLIFYKPSTDVVVTGCVCAPKGKQAYHLDCEVSVGPLRKVVRVYGDRSARLKAFGGVAISDPKPFSQMPLGYKKAYGGQCLKKNGTIVSFFPNPIGVGFAIKGGISEDAEELAVPNLEDPAFPVTTDNLLVSKFEEWVNAPTPASLGWTRRNFYPRYTFMGVLPEFLDVALKNREEMSKKYPELAKTEIKKMDFRAYQGASDGLWGKQLLGGEKVKLVYLDPKYPTLEFELPTERPTMTMNIGDGDVELEPALQTVVIDKEKNILTMLWRGLMEYGGIESFAQLSTFDYSVV